jgi:hypothetical protein
VVPVIQVSRYSVIQLSSYPVIQLSSYPVIQLRRPSPFTNQRTTHPKPFADHPGGSVFSQPEPKSQKSQKILKERIADIETSLRPVVGGNEEEEEDEEEEEEEEEDRSNVQLIDLDSVTRTWTWKGGLGGFVRVRSMSPP